MRLTKRQRALFEEAEAIAKLISLDFHNIEDRDIDPALALQIAIHKMVTGEVVIRYTLLDEILADLIAKYFFKSIDFQRLWRTKKFSTFVHHVLDEVYLLKKIEDALERDYFLTGEMAMEWGIVDKVINKRPEDPAALKVV